MPKYKLTLELSYTHEEIVEADSEDDVADKIIKIDLRKRDIEEVNLDEYYIKKVTDESN